MMKGGQVTVFIILGIILIVISGLIFLLKGTTVESIKEEINFFDSTSVQLYTEGCLEQTMGEAIYDVASKGGYYNLPIVVTEEAYVNTAYYMYLGGFYDPSTEEIENNLANYIDNNIEDCINFSIFPSFSIIAGSPKSSVTLTEEKVKVNLEYPLEIINSELIIELNSFEAETDSRLLILYNIAQEITSTQYKHNDFICISCLALLGVEHNVEILSVDTEEGTLYSIIDLESEISNSNGDPLSFRIMHKYTEGES